MATQRLEAAMHHLQTKITIGIPPEGHTNMSEGEEPNGIVIVEEPDRVVLAEDHGERGYSGIEIDSADTDEVRRLLKINEKQLMPTWAMYANQRNGAYALVDLWRLAAALRRSRPHLDIDALRRVSDAFELMHSRYQAELMVQAARYHPEGVTLCRKGARDERIGDFLVRGREFEVKTIQTLGTIERRRNGWTTSQVTANRLVRDLRRKAKQGFQQIASDGTVVCVVWCDFVGAVLATELAGFRIAGPDVFESHRYVVGARSEGKEDLWFGFPTHKEWKTALCDLQTNLNTRRYGSLPLGDPDIRFATNSKDWISMGRNMRIDGSRQFEN